MRLFPIILACLALLTSACVKRIPAQAGADLKLEAGETAKLGQPVKELPAGTNIQWSTGDGHRGSGPTLQYAWHRPGTFEVQVTVTDSDGQHRDDKAQVTVSRPPFLATLPASVPWVLWMDQPGERFGRLPLLLERVLASGQDANSVLSSVREGLGFDPFTKDGLKAAGLDPASAVGLVGWGDGEQFLLVAAPLEGDKGLETLKRLLGQGQAYNVSPCEKNMRIQVLRRDGKKKPAGAYAYFRGYLWFATDDGGMDPVAVLLQLLESGAERFSAKADVQAALKAVPATGTMSMVMDKAWLKDQSAKEASAEELKVWDSVGFVRMDMSQDDKGLGLTLRLGLAGDSAARLAGTIRSRFDVPPLASYVEPDRHGLFKMSMDLFGFARTVLDLSGQSQQWDEMLKAFGMLKQEIGVDLKTGLMDNLRDNMLMTLRMKPAGLLRVIGSQGQDRLNPVDLFEATLFVQLADVQAAAKVIEGLQKLASQGGPVGLTADGPMRWRLAVPQLPLTFLLKDGFAIVSTAAEAADRAAAAVSSPAAGASPWPKVLGSKEHQLMVLDLAKLVTDFEKAEMPADNPSAAFMKAMVMGGLAKVSGLGMIWLDMVAEPGVFTFTLRLDTK